MRIYVALLRAINVSGHNMIRMSELKRMFEAMGFGRVQTYIQSGNVLFESEEEEQPLRRRIEQELQAVFGLSVTVVLRTVEELERIAGNCPFPADSPAGGLYVALLAEAPAQEGIERLATYHSDSDEFRIAGREVYLFYHQGAGKAKLSNSLLERKLGVEATSRNWRTINKLAEMGRAASPDSGAFSPDQWG